MAVHHDTFKSAIASAFENSDIKFSKVSDLSKEEFEEKVWNDIKEINTTVPKYKHVKKIIVTDEPMIKTTTAKIKRFEEIEKIIKEKQIEL